MKHSPALAALAMLAVAVLSPGSARADNITLILDWFLNPDHAPVIIADERGYFADEGLNLTIIEPADPNDPPKLVAAGQADFAISYQPQLHLQVAQGLPVTRIATLVATPLNALVVLADGPINSIADLNGKTIGFSVGGFEDALLGAMLEKHGLTLSDVSLVNVNFALTPALLSGRVDAVIGAFRNFELNHLQLEGHAGRAFFPEENGVPAYDELIVIANSERINNDIAARFIRALERGVTWLVNHPDEGLNLFTARRPDLDNDLNRRAWRDTLPRFALRPAALHGPRYEEFAEFLADRGLIPEALPAERYGRELE